jgi:hypothetical protein
METPLVIDSMHDLCDTLDFLPMSVDILLKVAGYTSLNAARELTCHVSTVRGNTELVNIEVLLVKHDA